MIAAKLDTDRIEDPLPESLGSAVLVTGCSTGIGHATALRLVRRGSVVFAGVRRLSDADALVREVGSAVRPVVLDVTDASAIARALEYVEAQRDLRLDGIVNNAGVALGGPLEILPLSELRKVFDVNFFGAIAVTQAFLPMLRETGGRVVNVSSIGGKLALPFLGAYASSKFALEAASDALRVELLPFGVDVAIVEPGAVKTPIWTRSSEASTRIFDALPDSERGPYEPMVRKMQEFAQRLGGQGMPADQVARVIEHALFSKSPRARYLVGTEARMRLVIARLPEFLRDRMLASVLGITRKPRRSAKR